MRYVTTRDMKEIFSDFHYPNSIRGE